MHILFTGAIFNDDATNGRRTNPQRIFPIVFLPRSGGASAPNPGPRSYFFVSAAADKKEDGRRAGMYNEVPQLACDNDLRHVLCVCVCVLGK